MNYSRRKILSYALAVVVGMMSFAPTASAQVFDETDGFTNEEIFTFDDDNTGAGANVDLVANQGSDNDGTLRYNATTNQWEISNDGGAFSAIQTAAGAGNTLDEAYDQGGAGAGRTITVDSGAVDLSGTGSLLNLGDGTASTFTITFDEDGTDGTLSWDSTNDEFDFSDDLNTEGNINLGDGTAADSTITFDEDGTDGVITWDNTNDDFGFSDAIDVEGDAFFGDGTAADITLTFDEDGTDGTIVWDNTNDEFDFNSDITSTASITAGTTLDANGNTMTLDADNAGGGANVDIVANQGTDNDGTIRYNATTNEWEISNDGGTFFAISTSNTNNTLDDAYDQGGAGAGRTVTVDSGAIDLSGTGSLLNLGDGTASTFTITFDEDGTDGTLSWDSTNDEFDFSDDLNTEGDINLGNGTAADVTLTFDEDGTDGTIVWDNANDEFDFNSDVSITGSATTTTTLTVGTTLDVNGNTTTFDADNAGAGANVDLVAEQGTDSNGTLRYDAAANEWQVSNDGGAFNTMATVADGTKYVWLDINGAGDTTRIGQVGQAPALLFANSVLDFAVWSFALPSDWVSGTDLTINLYWSPDDTNTGNVEWTVNGQGLASGDDASSTTTADNFIQAAIGTVDQMQETTTNLTIGSASLAADDLVTVRVERDGRGSNADDTFTGTAQLHGVRVSYTGRVTN